MLLAPVCAERGYSSRKPEERINLGMQMCTHARLSEKQTMGARTRTSECLDSRALPSHERRTRRSVAFGNLGMIEGVTDFSCLNNFLSSISSSARACLHRLPLVLEAAVRAVYRCKAGGMVSAFWLLSCVFEKYPPPWSKIRGFIIEVMSRQGHGSKKQKKTGGPFVFGQRATAFLRLLAAARQRV